MTTMSQRAIACAADLDRLIPTHMRWGVKEGTLKPLWAVNAPDYDRMPISTYLVRTTMGTEGRHFEHMIKIVRPNRPELYPKDKRTPDGRLLYAGWALGRACKRLVVPKRDTFRHIILPGDPRWETVDAFQTACDHVRASNPRAVPFEPKLLYRALGIEPLTQHEQGCLT